MGHKCYYRCGSCGGTNRVPSERIHAAPVCGRCGEVLDTGGSSLRLTDETLEAVMEKAPVPLVLAFVADGSEESERFMGVLGRIGAEFTGTVWVLEVDADRNADKHAQFGIRSVPQMMLIQEKEIRVRKQGFRSYEALRALLERHVNPYV